MSFTASSSTGSPLPSSVVFRLSLAGTLESAANGGGGTEERGRRERGERERRPINDFLFLKKKKKPIHLRGEWRHQIRVLGEFKRGVDVAHGDWFGVREGTHLLGEHPLHRKLFIKGRVSFLSHLLSFHFYTYIDLLLPRHKTHISITFEREMKAKRERPGLQRHAVEQWRRAISGIVTTP
ncbi:hypothetical protein Hanom_Chr09g00867471 [Helianthus anomalus]